LAESKGMSMMPGVVRTLSLHVSLVVCFALLHGRPQPAAAADGITKTHVKAAFIAKIANYVTWPKKSFPDSRSPLVIGVMGAKDPFKGILGELVAGTEVGGRPLQVKQFKTFQDLENCHLLFIPRSDDEVLAQVVKALAGRSVLTIGGQDGFAEKWGILNIARITHKTNKELGINLQRAKEARLKLSVRLLKLKIAKIVQTEPGD